MPKINLSSIPANLLDCLAPSIKSIWDHLSRDKQIHELEKARENLEFRQGPGKSWCDFIQNDLGTFFAKLNYYERQLFGRTLSSEELTEYLCAEHGMTRPEALGLTPGKALGILQADYRRSAIPAPTASASGGSGEPEQQPPASSGGVPREDEPSEPARHSKDFRSVHWYGDDYTFSPTQAACVKVLWEEWKKGTPELGQATILEAPEVEAESKRLIDILKEHPAWGRIIVKGHTAGTYRLAKPPKVP